MSALGAERVAAERRAFAPSRPESTPRRHLEVAPTRQQRRARPAVLPAIVTIAGIGVILLVQLVLSIVLADGAYRISTLQQEQRDLERQEESLGERLETLRSAQHLARNAEALGMVASGSLPYLDLETGAVTGTASPAGEPIVGADTTLVGNSLLTDIDLIAVPETPGVAAPEAGAAPVPSVPGTLPSPTTH